MHIRHTISDSLGDMIRLFEDARGIAALVVLMVLVSFFGVGVLWGVVACVLAYLAFRHPDFGIYVLVLLTPMTGLVITGEWLATATGGFLDVTDFFALAVDVWAFFLLLLFGMRIVWRWGHRRPIEIVAPGMWLYGLFLLASVLSLLHLPRFEIIEGFKYLIRFPLFVYIAYLVMGVNTIEHKRVLHRALTVYVWVGVFAGLLGLVSLVLNISGVTGLYRAVPIGLFGIDVFNYAGDVRFGHILLAEHLTTVLPIAVYLAVQDTSPLRTRRYVYVSMFLGVVCLLTFSRAGWVTLLLQAMVFVALFRTYIPWKRIGSQLAVAGVLFAVVAAYMVSTLSSSVVASSNSARIVLTEIGWHYFTERPLFGQGIGRYTVLLEDVDFFTYNFGDPIDAHSILTKISTEQGIVGLLTFGLFIGWILLEIYRRMQHDGFSRTARSAAFLSFFLVLTPLIFQLFNTQYYSARMWVPFMFAVSLIFLYRDDRSRMSGYMSFLPKKTHRLIANVFRRS